MHDAFVEIPQRDTFNQQRVSTVLAIHPTGPAESPMKVPFFACVANAYHSKKKPQLISSRSETWL